MFTVTLFGVPSRAFCKYSCRFLLICAVLAMGVIECSAQQDLKQIVPPSPTVAALGTYGSIPMGYYTGTPNISVPIHEIKSGDLSLSVSLSYRANGIKVEEMASNVGLGWSLNAGGIITRSLRGLPDEGGGGYMSPAIPKAADIFAAAGPGFNWRCQFAPLSCFPSPEVLAWQQDIANGNIDGEPDLFYFNFGGYSGKFYYNQQTGEFVTIPRKAIFFDADYFRSSRNWHIITEDGTEYFFTRSEVNTNYNLCNGSSATPRPITTGWFLTEIRSQATGRHIDFDYEPVAYEIKNIASHTIKTPIQGSGAGADECLKSSTCYSYNSYQGYRLKTITFDGGRLEFKSLTDRCDLLGDKRLDNIEVYNYNETSPYKKIEFGYEYFNGGNLAVSGCGNLEASYTVRLKLNSVKTLNANGQSLPPYTFEYDERSLPGRLSYAQDAWGYYNGASENQNLVPAFIDVNMFWDGANRNVDTVKTSVGVLQKLNYPTGGHTSFQYENNRVGRYVKFAAGEFFKTRTPFLDTSTPCAADNRPVYCKPFKVNNTMGSGVYMNITIDGVGCWDCSQHPLPVATTCALMELDRVDTVGNIAFRCSQNNVFVPNGDYILRADFTGADNPTLYQDFGISLYWQEYNLPPGTHSSAIGGLRVKKITDNDGQKDVSVREFEYGPGYLSDYEFFHPYGMFCENNVQYWVRDSYSSVPMGSTQGNSVGYSTVTEHFHKSSLSGKTVYTYSTAEVFQDVFFLRYPFGDPIDVDYRRGLLLKKEDYKWIGRGYRIVRSQENNYKPLDVHYNWEEIWVPSPDPNYDQTIAYRCAPNLPGNPYPWAAGYKVMSEWVRQTESIERVYDDDGGYLETITNTEYDNPTHMQATRTKQTGSDGDTTITYMKYPLDYAEGAGSGVSVLQDKHFITPVIEKVTSKKTPNGVESILGGVIQTYKTTKPLPGSVYSFESALPIGVGSFTFSNAGTSFAKDLRYTRRIDFTNYDYSHGNLLEQTKENDMPISYLWAHNYTLPITEVKNANYANIFHTSFEEDGGAFVDGAGKNLAHTGLRVLNSSSYVIPSTFSPTTSISNLKMSYWYWNGTEWKFSGELPYTATINAAGSKLDEVRVYPQGAQMTTYAYDPGVGVISVTDPGGVTAYYEYDKFARLQYIRDNKGKLVKSFRYHYKGQP